MSSWLLLRAMIAKELRTLLRERHQLLGLLLPMAAFVIVIPMMGHLFKDVGPTLANPHAASAAGEAWSAEAILLLRWVAIGVGAAVGAFLAMGYLMPSILAAFAGERDSRTLEVLLASPVPDTRLFLLKCLSILLPVAAIGYLYMLIIAGLSAYCFRGILSQIPVHILGYALLAGVPVMLLIEMAVASLGAAVSVRAETLKGAGHVLGGVAMLVFLSGYSIPLLMRYEPANKALTALARFWMSLPFTAQYGLVLVILAIPTILFLAIGWALFQRDRLLT